MEAAVPGSVRLFTFRDGVNDSNANDGGRNIILSPTPSDEPADPVRVGRT